MTVEDCSNNNEGGDAKFNPEGLEVLVVDDDRAPLEILTKLLTICKYKVTATTTAIDALQILRANRDRFDLVISDVHMPDMDGFKLLELIGLEMDLPVIMLSANGETDTVMRGINHGAVDYLLKPVRIEDLKVIWKHVVMKKNKQSSTPPQVPSALLPTLAVDDINQTNNNGSNSGGSNGGRGKRRIEEGEEEEEREGEEGGERRKIKQRVVWSVDLHRKFVEAVNDLGIDKAVPKKILDKMSVEQLTRENVASHLQKYRLYLKRLSGHAIPRPSQTGFGSRNSQLIHLSSLESFRNYHNSGRYRQYVPAMPAVRHSPVPYQSPAPVGNFGTNQVANATSAALTLPSQVPLSSAGNVNVINSNNGILASNNNVVNNQNNSNLFMGVAGTTTSTFSFSYLTQTNNNVNNNNNGINAINYGTVGVPQVGQITNLPSMGGNISPIGVTGENYAVGTEGDLQQVVSQYNRMRNLNINNNTNDENNTNLVNQGLSALFNPLKNMNNNNNNLNVGTNGEMSFGSGNGTGNSVVDQLSSSNGDNSALNNVDDLISAFLKPMDGDSLFVDDMFANGGDN
ncbi:hypothetical protein LUZ60_017183 [Juncus effusus]|nr:hypothetical protein LUZ60_017183 [Juncus effusus]